MGYPEAQYVIDELQPTIDSLITSSKIQIMIHDYKMFGVDSYVYNTPEYLDAIYLSMEGVNDKTINVEGLDYAITKGGTALHTWLCNLAPTKSQASTLFANINTMANLAANTNAITAVINNPVAVNAIVASEAAMTAIAANATSLGVAVNNDVLISAIAGNKASMNKVAANATLLDIAFTNTTSKTRILGSSVAMTSMATTTTAVNKIVADQALMTEAVKSAAFLNNVVKNATRKKAFAQSAYLQTLMPTIRETVQDTRYFVQKYSNGTGTTHLDSEYYYNGSSQATTTVLSADTCFAFVDKIYSEHATNKSSAIGLLLNDTITGTGSGWTNVPYLFIGGVKSKPYSTSSSYDAHGVQVTIYMPV